jgi:hypothetical protein
MLDASGARDVVRTRPVLTNRRESTMPETFGKRQRKDVKARKAAAAEERRLARAQRRRDREAGLIEPGPPVATAEEIEEQLGNVPPSMAE